MRFKSFLALILLLSVAFLMPAAAADASSESEVTDPIYLKGVPQGSFTISVESGSRTASTFYIISNSDSCLLLDVYTEVDDSDLFASASIEVQGSDFPLLYPGTRAEPGIAILTVEVQADRYADRGSSRGAVVVSAETTDPTDAEAFLLTIPFIVEISSSLASGEDYNSFFGVFPNGFSSPFDGAWFAALVTFVVWILATVILSELVIPLFTRLVGDRKTHDEKRKLTNNLTKIITGIMVVVCIEECARILGAGPEVIDAIGSVSNALFIVFGALLAWMIYIFVVTAFLKGLEGSDSVDGVDTSLLPLFKMIGRIAIAVSACCAILSIFGVDLASIMISAGVITLGITLGAQSILGQFFSGIVLLATRPFKKGDYVLMNGETYVVEKVRIMFTEFRNWSGDQIVTIPNDTVSSTAIRNVTRSDPWTRVFLDVTVAYGSDVEMCKRCLVDAACRHPHVISDGRVSKPSPRLQELGPSGITFRLAVWVDDYDDSIVYSGEIRELMYAELRSNGVDVPYDRHQVEVLQRPVQD